MRRRPGWLVAWSVAAGLAFVLAALPTAGRERAPSAEELTNYQLAPAYALWLLGPISRLADDEERDAYLALSDDEAAAQFIHEFWERRGGMRPFPPTPAYLFEQRAAEADVLYREGLHVGHATDRGTIYVLYGPPGETRFEASPSPGGEAVEVWLYPKDTQPGLDGQPPKGLYTFRRDAEGLTRFYNLPVRRRLVGAEEPPR
ncbi:MAG: GWxTD domain-containing protein [Thermoanaerobaculia bacterium]